MNVLLTGATGFIGQRLGQELVTRGHQVIALTRHPQSAQFSYPCQAVRWEAEKGQLETSLESIEAVVNLAGEPIAGSRWNKTVKEKLWNSRVHGTRNLLERLTSPTHTLVSASAIGFYGDRGEESLTETSSKGQGFLSDLCESWELEAKKFSGRTVILRFGMVLDGDGGALKKMIPAFRYGLGGPLGNGHQWMSWIHREDLVKLIADAIEDKSFSGTYNAVALDPARNKEFSRTLAAEFSHKIIMPGVPRLALKLAFGELAEVLLSSQKVYPERLLNQGFKFQYPDLKSALHRSIQS